MSIEIDPSIAADIATAGDLSDHAPRLGKGDHLVALYAVESKKTREYGGAVFIEMVIVQSTSHTAGERRADGWFISKNGDAGMYERKRMNAFARAVVQSLGGNPDDPEKVSLNGKEMTKGQALVAQTLGAMLSGKQPGRGVLLRISTTSRSNKEKTKSFDNNAYSHVVQTREQIKGMREKLEAAPMAAAPATAAATPNTTSATASAAPVTNHLDSLF